MKNVKKWLAVATLSLACVSSFALGATAITSAETVITPKTVDEVSIAMKSGASVRMATAYEDLGIRYAFTMSETDYTALLANEGETGAYKDVSFGVFVAPKYYYDIYPIDNEEKLNTYYCWNGEQEGKEEILNLVSQEMLVNEEVEGERIFYGAVVNMLPENLVTEYIGIGYVKYTTNATDTAESKTHYRFVTQNDNVRSMVYVAQLAIDAGKDTDNVLATSYLTDTVKATETTYTVKHMLSDGNGGYTEGATETISDGVTVGGLTEDATAKEFADYTYDKTDAAKAVYANGKTVVNAYYVNNRVKNFTEENGVWTAQGNTADSNWQSQYAYTSTNYSDTVVYSVKINAPQGFDKSDYGAVPHVGITLTDGSQIYGGTFDNDGRVLEGAYKAIQIGLTPYSLYSQCGTNARMNRNLDNSANYAAAYTSADHAYGFVEGVTERTLTIALYKDMLYIYVDGAFAKSYSVTDYTNNVPYFNTAFAANSQYRFGIHATSIDHSVYPVSFVVEKELYGDEAKTEIESKYIYSITCDGTTTSTFSNTTASETVVYSIDVNTVNGVPMPNCNASGHVGITISTSGNTNEVMTIGFGQVGITSACNRGMWRRWDNWGNFSAVNSAYAFASSNNVGGTLKSGKLTVVIYNNTLYVYAGATTENFVYSNSIVYNGGAVNLSSFTATSQWVVGVGATEINNVLSGYEAWGITIIERNRLYGDEAIEYIKANYSANITVTE